MKVSRLLPLCLLLVLACLTLGTAASQWDKDDHEIFDLQAALEESEGKGTTFYSVLGLPRSASQGEIKRAYRKKSLELHPDKNGGTARAQKRFEQLGLVNKILRDARKDRYDHFVTHGFPRWRGTGYFYSRFRPGLGSVLVGLVGFSVCVEVLVRRVSAAQERARVAQLQRSARLVAWGPRFEQHLRTADRSLPEKKVRVPLAGFADMPPEPRPDQDWEEHERAWKKCIANNAASAGRAVEVRVTQDETLVHVDDEWWPLDPDAVATPGFAHTWPARLVASLTGRSATPAPDDTDDADAQTLEHQAQDVIASASASASGASPATAPKKRKGGKRT